MNTNNKSKKSAGKKKHGKKPPVKAGAKTPVTHDMPSSSVLSAPKNIQISSQPGNSEVSLTIGESGLSIHGFAVSLQYNALLSGLSEAVKIHDNLMTLNGGDTFPIRFLFTGNEFLGSAHLSPEMRWIEFNSTSMDCKSLKMVIRDKPVKIIITPSRAKDIVLDIQIKIPSVIKLGPGNSVIINPANILDNKPYPIYIETNFILNLPKPDENHRIVYDPENSIQVSIGKKTARFFMISSQPCKRTLYYGDRAGGITISKNPDGHWILEIKLSEEGVRELALECRLEARVLEFSQVEVYGAVKLRVIPRSEMKVYSTGKKDKGKKNKGKKSPESTGCPWKGKNTGPLFSKPVVDLDRDIP